MRFNAKTQGRKALQTGKYKLAEMVEQHEGNEELVCRVVVRRGVLQTIVEDGRKYVNEEEENRENWQYNRFQGGGKQDCGLFAHILKTLEVKKQGNVNNNQPRKCDKPRGYTYYFDEQTRKERSAQKYLKITDNDAEEQDHFQRIDVTQQGKRNSQKEQQLIREDVSNKENIRVQRVEQFIDMNFSFDEINKQLQSVKKEKVQELAEGDTIVNKIYNKNSYAEEESSKNVEIKSSKQLPKQSVKQSIKQINKLFSINFAKLSKQRKNQEQIQPSERDAVLKTQKDSIEGTKKVESRIYSCKPVDNIEIDFDLDINFV